MERMKLYDVKIRLNGELTNEVWRQNVTAAEIKVLEFIHGRGPNYPIAEMILKGSVAREDRNERARLLGLYGEFNLGEGGKMLRDVLGFETMPLPREYIAPTPVDPEEFDVEQKVVFVPDNEKIVQEEKPTHVAVPEARRTRVAPAAAQPKADEVKQVAASLAE